MEKIKFPSKQAFKDYLGSLKTKNVTEFCTGGNCPLAQWFIDSGKVPAGWRIAVELHSTTIYPGGSVDEQKWIDIINPAWATEFINKVDQLNAVNIGGLGWRKVSPEQALVCVP